MKEVILVLTSLLFLCFCISGCTTVSINRFTETEYSSVEDSEDIEIFHLGHHIPIPYTELAEITLARKNVCKLKEEAAKLGADAVIILGPARTGFLSNHINFRRQFLSLISFGLGVAVGSGEGWVALAIRFVRL